MNEPSQGNWDRANQSLDNSDIRLRKDASALIAFLYIKYLFMRDVDE